MVREKESEAISKLSKALVKSGKTEYTPEKIEHELSNIMKSEGLTRKSSALSLFKSKPDIKRAMTAGDLEEIRFDVISVRDGETQDGKNTPYQEIYIAVDRNRKPEFRVAMLYDRKIDVSKDCAYKAKANIGDNKRVSFPDDAKLEKLEKLIFTTSQLKEHSDPTEDIKPGMSGVYYGDVGKVSTKGESSIVEVSTLGSFLPTSMWINDISMVSNVLEGDEIVFGGFMSKKGKFFNPSFIKVVADTNEHVKEDELR